MSDDRPRKVAARVPKQTQPQIQVYVFHVSKEIFIKPSGFLESRQGISAGSGTGADNFAFGWVGLNERLPVVFAPCQPAGSINIPLPIQTGRVMPVTGVSKASARVLARHAKAQPAILARGMSKR